MTLFILSLFLGGLIGYTWRKNTKFIGRANKLIDITVFCLLFLMGIGLSMKSDVLGSLSSLGWEAFVIAAGSILGSSMLIAVVTRTILKNH
jgi:hypothetical protein